MTEELYNSNDEENEEVVSQDLILLKDVNYFGRIIRRGSTFKSVDKDWYVLYENNNGIIMHCPSIKIHFTSINSEYFVKQYESFNEDKDDELLIDKSDKEFWEKN